MRASDRRSPSGTLGSRLIASLEYRVRDSEERAYPPVAGAALALASAVALLGALAPFAFHLVGSLAGLAAWAVAIVMTEPFLWVILFSGKLQPRPRALVHVLVAAANLAILISLLVVHRDAHEATLHLLLVLTILDAASGSLDLNRGVPLGILAVLLYHGDPSGAVMLGTLVLAAGIHETRRTYGRQARDRHIAGLLEEVARAKDEAHTDALTGLFTRRILEERVEDVFDLCRARRLPFALLLVDLDHFKDVNDRYGHAAGDEVLRSAGRALLSERRDDDVIVRFGGDEMLVVTTSVGDCDQLRAFAERVLVSLRSVSLPGGEPLSASIGGYCHPALTVGSLQEALDLADGALYAAKHRGRGQAVLASDL